MRGALDAVSAELDTDTLAALVEDVVIDKRDAADGANDFLQENQLAG